MKYCDLYKSLKNPLYDNEILEDIVDTYSNSSNFSEDILKVNSKNDYSVFGDDLEDKNIFGYHTREPIGSRPERSQNTLQCTAASYNK